MPRPVVRSRPHLNGRPVRHWRSGLDPKLSAALVGSSHSILEFRGWLGESAGLLLPALDEGAHPFVAARVALRVDRFEHRPGGAAIPLWSMRIRLEPLTELLCPGIDVARVEARPNQGLCGVAA